MYKPKYAWSVKSSQPASKSKTNTKDVTNRVKLRNKFTVLQDKDKVFTIQDACESSSVKKNVVYSEQDAQSASKVEEMASEYGSKVVTQKGNKDVVDVLVEAKSDQAIHAKILHKADNKSMISDHSLSVQTILSLSAEKPKPFKFFNFLAYKESFSEVVSNQWSNQIKGHSMYQALNAAKIDEEHFLKQKAKL
ncbi:hypothetical protein Tco_0485076 [Tanacetum coccineum]